MPIGVWLRVCRDRMRALVGRERVIGEIGDELRHHEDQLAARLEREGRPREDARREARRRVGNIVTLTDAGYIGLAVHTAARVCAAAHGGQVLVSGATRAAVDRPSSVGIRFRDLGRHRLHGLAEPEALFQVMGKGLRAEFPRPRTKGRSRRNAKKARKA